MKHYNYSCCIALLLTLISLAVKAQSGIGIGGQPHPSAALDVPSTSKAFYPPRMTSAQRKAIVNPQAGAFVYDSDRGTFYLYNGQSWLPMALSDPNTIPPLSYTASDGTPDSNFGQSVSISGDYAIVGAPESDIGSNPNQGAAYIFVRSGSGWTQQAKLTLPDGAANDYFGQGVAIEGNYAVVGAFQDDVLVNGVTVTNRGAAYVFVRDGSNWTQQAQLIASDGTINDYFGSKVAISGDYIVVNGGDDDITVGGSTNADQGSAFVFVRSGTTWTEQAKLTASDGSAYTYFGNSVAISGNYVLIGAYNDNVVVGGTTNPSQGSAYVFLRTGTTWAQQAKLTASDGAASDRFGAGVSISGDYAIVGADIDDATFTNQGSAYVFLRTGTTWTQQIKLTAPDAAANDYFGVSVSISGDHAIVGAYLDDAPNTDQGSAYIYTRSGTTWTLLRKVPDASPAVSFVGAAVGIVNGTFIIGAPAFQNDRGKIAIGTLD